MAKESSWPVYYTLFVENGRVADERRRKIKSALLKVAQTKKANFRFTCNQNVILSDIKEEDKKEIENILARAWCDSTYEWIICATEESMACVALSTCPLALAEASVICLR